MKRQIRNLKSFLLLPIFFLLTGSMSAYATPSLPSANITGRLVTDANNTLSLSLSFISQVNYLDTSYAQGNTPGIESIIGATVTMTGATRVSPGSLTFTDGLLEVKGSDSYTYISATVNSISLTISPDGTVALNPNLDATNPATLNLVMSALNTDTTHPSRFVDEWRTALNGGTIAGMLIMAELQRDNYGNIIGDPTGVSNSNISMGLLDGSPAAPPAPITARSMGYWKTHDAERGQYLSSAIAVDNRHKGAFHNSSSQLEDAVITKGKKTMLQKAQQELGALLLNIAAGLSEGNLLSVSQLELIDPVLNTPTVVEDTVGEAVDDIEAVILNPLSTSSDLERVKDLAESINTAE